MEERSFIVQAKSLDEALERASVLLHCSVEQVAYEIMQQPVPGRNGRINVPCKLRVMTGVCPEDSEANDEIHDPEAGFTCALPPENIEHLSCVEFLQTLEAATESVLNAVPFTPVETLPAFFTGSPTTRKIVSDVTVVTGQITHHGDLIIEGTVKKGARIRVSGSLSISGDVESAVLIADGSIYIDGGLLGNVTSTSGNITCKFAQGARLKAPNGSVTIHESAMHCEINSGQIVSIGDTLVGGLCFGRQMVDVRTAGSSFGTPTQIIAGHNKSLLDEIAAIRQRAMLLIAALGHSENIRAELQPSEEGDIPLPLADRVRLWNAVNRKAWLNAQLLQLSRQKSALLGMINADKSVRTCVKDRAYPRVKIIVDDCPLEIHNLTQFAIFSKDYETGKLRVTSYQ